jgi:hypothetical protein
MSQQPNDEPKPRARVDPEDIRRALDEQAKKRPPRPPAIMINDPIPRLRVEKPANRSRRKKK